MPVEQDPRSFCQSRWLGEVPPAGGGLQGRVDEAFFEPLPQEELECWRA